MILNERIQICRLSCLIKNNEKFSKEIGIKDTTHFRKKEKSIRKEKKDEETK